MRPFEFTFVGKCMPMPLTFAPRRLAPSFRSLPAVAMARCLSAPGNARIASIRRMGGNAISLNSASAASHCPGGNKFFSGVSVLPTLTGLCMLGQADPLPTYPCLMHGYVA